MLSSYAIVDSHLFYDEVVDIQVWGFLTKSRAISDTKVTVKVCGPLVYFLVNRKKPFYINNRYHLLKNISYWLIDWLVGV